MKNSTSVREGARERWDKVSAPVFHLWYSQIIAGEQWREQHAIFFFWNWLNFLKLVRLTADSAIKLNGMNYKTDLRWLSLHRKIWSVVVEINKLNSVK